VIGVPDALALADNVPHVAPLQPVPESFQVTPLFAGSFVTVAVNACIAPACTLAVGGATVTAIGAGAAVTVIVAEADFVVSATDVAVSVTVGGVGTFAGAVYVIATPEPLDAADNVPHVAPLQPAPESAHVTPLLAGSLVTVAVNGCAAPTCTLAVVGATVTLIGNGGAVKVIVTEADFVVSSTDFAVTVTEGGVGRLAGAV
jgi:hypothetical protein